MDHFGKLLTQGLKSIAALEKTELTELQDELGNEIGVSVWTIYKWRKGTSIPNDDRTIALLAKACVRRGRMTVQWLQDFLKHTIYSNKQALIEELFPDQAATTVIHNLPRRQHKKLIGRDKELEEIKNFLSPRHRVGVVCISGSGGVGKTALALEIAHSCYEDQISLSSDECFDAIIWVTAKTVELLPGGRVKRQATFNDLDGIYRAIAELLDIPVIFRAATQAEQNIIVTRVLADKRVLLMLDNLEDVDDDTLMIFLRDLPAPSKAVITTRHRIDVAVPIYLHSLNEATADELVRVECERHKLHLDNEQIKMLLQRTGGLPLAIVRTIGRMAWRGSDVDTEILHLRNPQNEIYDFCFGKTISLIANSSAFYLFMSLALYASDTTRESLGVVTGFATDPQKRDEGLSDLELLSLCHKTGDCFGLEPLTRTQALTILHEHPEFETEARERWLNWYLDFTTLYGGRDWSEMHLRYDYLEEDWDNILSVIRWCMDQERYEQTVALWQNVRDFTHIYGFWSDRISLLDWQIIEAENRRDYSMLVQFMYDKAFTLTLTGPSSRLEAADSLLRRCWSLRQYASLVLQAKVTALTASLCVKQRDHDEAHKWLAKSEALLQEADIDPVERARERASMLFDKGENYLVIGDYTQAQLVFEDMLEQAQISGWQRSILHARNWLAYTSLLQNNPVASKDYLQSSWIIASRIKERRLSAYFQRSYAYYFRAIGDQVSALQWTKDALDSFERLGMPPDIEEMQTLLKNLNDDLSMS